MIFVDHKFRIHRAIHIFRGRAVILDFELANLYRTSTSAINQAVKRNKKLFSRDCVIVLSRKDILNLISQIVTSSFGYNSEVVRRFSRYRHGGPRKITRAFTEKGITALADVFRRTSIKNITRKILKVWHSESRRAFGNDIIF